jgi:hypothetical protein
VTTVVFLPFSLLILFSISYQSLSCYLPICFKHQILIYLFCFTISWFKLVHSTNSFIWFRDFLSSHWRLEKWRDELKDMTMTKDRKQTWFPKKTLSCTIYWVAGFCCCMVEAVLIENCWRSWERLVLLRYTSSKSDWRLFNERRSAAEFCKSFRTCTVVSKSIHPSLSIKVFFWKRWAFIFSDGMGWEEIDSSRGLTWSRCHVLIPLVLPLEHLVYLLQCSTQSSLHEYFSLQIESVDKHP